MFFYTEKGNLKKHPPEVREYLQLQLMLPVPFVKIDAVCENGKHLP